MKRDPVLREYKKNHHNSHINNTRRILSHRVEGIYIYTLLFFCHERNLYIRKTNKNASNQMLPQGTKKKDFQNCEVPLKQQTPRTGN